MRKQETERIISEYFQEEARRVPVPSDLKAGIDRRIQLAGRSRKMKLFSAKKIVIAAAAVALLGSITAVAAGHIATRESHSSVLDQVEDYGKIDSVRQEVGFDFPSLESFSNGFAFQYALPIDSSDYDEDGNVLSAYKTVGLSYSDGTQDVNIYIDAHSSATEGGADGSSAVRPVWSGEKAGIPLTVTQTVHKFVPPDYELTEEDLQLQASGDVVFSYGSVEVITRTSYSCMFDYDGLSYDIMGFDLTLQPEALADMAPELIAAGK